MKIKPVFVACAVTLIASVVATLTSVGVYAEQHKSKSYNRSVTSTVSIIDQNRDDFSSTVLGSQWYWVREDPAHWSLTSMPGYLRITATATDIWQDFNTAPLLLQSFSADSFEIRTRVTLTPTTDYQQAGLIIYGDDDNYLRLSYGYMGQVSFEFGIEENGVFQSTQLAAPNGNSFHLSLLKIGAKGYAYYSQTGDTWISIGQAVDFSHVVTNMGLFAFSSNETTPEIPADFDFFEQLETPKVYLPLIVR